MTSEQKAKLASRFRFGEDADPVWKVNFVQRLLGYADAFSQAEFDIARKSISNMTSNSIQGRAYGTDPGLFHHKT